MRATGNVMTIVLDIFAIFPFEHAGVRLTLRSSVWKRCIQRVRVHFLTTSYAFLPACLIRPDYIAERNPIDLFDAADSRRVKKYSPAVVRLCIIRIILPIDTRKIELPTAYRVTREFGFNLKRVLCRH